MVEMPEAHPEDSGRNLRTHGQGAPNVAARREPSRPEESELIDAVVERENMKRALRRVQVNKRAPGVDGMTVDELLPYLRREWPRIKEELLNGTYRPAPVRTVEIPKPGGKGTRMLGIPTALDRLIQQALHQVMSPLLEPYFSDSSYGFRPGRSAHDAVLQAQAHVESGKRLVVDMDLEKFFDRVNHDVLMSRVARRVSDKRVLKLIRSYLRAGMMQGGPLSPLLSNIFLDDLDKELERRGHAFCRYAHPDPTRLEQLLQAGAGEECIRGIGRMAPAEASVHPLASVETLLYASAQPDETWTDGGARMEVRHQWARRLVECRSLTYEPSLPEVLL